MFFSYTASVILLSLGMYGMWCFLHDMWIWWLEPKMLRIPSCSFMVMIKELDFEVEELIRLLVREIEDTDLDCDVVVVDGSNDNFTMVILDRLAEETNFLRIVNIPNNARPFSEGISLCRGAVVHVLDLGNRITREEFMVTVCALLRQDKHEVIVRARGRE